MLVVCLVADSEVETDVVAKKVVKASLLTDITPSTTDPSGHLLHSALSEKRLTFCLSIDLATGWKLLLKQLSVVHPYIHPVSQPAGRPSMHPFVSFIVTRHTL